MDYHWIFTSNGKIYTIKLTIMKSDKLNDKNIEFTYSLSCIFDYSSSIMYLGETILLIN